MRWSDGPASHERTDLESRSIERRLETGERVSDDRTLKLRALVDGSSEHSPSSGPETGNETEIQSSKRNAIRYRHPTLRWTSFRLSHVAQHRLLAGLLHDRGERKCVQEGRIQCKFRRVRIYILGKKILTWRGTQYQDTGDFNFLTTGGVLRNLGEGDRGLFS